MMRTTNGRMAAATAAATALGLALTGCGGPADGSAAKGDGTVTLRIADDPGSLSPTTSLAGTAIAMNRFAYAGLVFQNADGSLVPEVAEKWSATATSAQFTIRDGVTCQDGSKLTAADVAAEFDYIGDPKNQSPLIGLTVPVGATATADLAARTVTVTTKQPAPFIVEMTLLMPLLCEKDLANPTALAKASAATGPYQLSEAVPGDHYTYVKRAGYAWGPNGSTDAAMPAKVVFKVIGNETTAANLLLSGQINGAVIVGPDTARLEAAKLASKGVKQPFGQFMFDEDASRPTADEAVRRALIQALDLKQLGVVSSSDAPQPATSIGEIAPTPCTADTVTGNVAPFDLAAAANGLTAAGWAKDGSGIWARNGKELTVKYLYPTSLGPTVVSASELVAKEWTALGVKVTSASVDQANVVSTLAAGDWDVAWEPIGVNLPDQLVPFYSGARPPQGNNLPRISNPDYEKLAAQAEAQAGTAGCPLWQQADSALVKRSDVVPFVNILSKTYGKGITFDVDPAGVIPSTLRLGS
jgi:peptide/nickel transport system substrate-binding protein